MTGFSREFDIPLTSLKDYLRGSANLRADTIALLAEKLGLTPAELVSGVPDVWRRAAAACEAAYELSSWPPERRERMIALFLSLVELFSEADAP